METLLFGKGWVPSGQTIVWPTSAGTSGRELAARPQLLASAAAERIIALVLPVAALVRVGHFHRDDVFRILEAELGRHTNLHRIAVGLRQDLVGKLEGHLG